MLNYQRLSQIMRKGSKETLVGGDWNMAFIFPETVGSVIIPIDELIFFTGVGSTWLNHQPGIYDYICIYGS